MATIAAVALFITSFVYQVRPAAYASIATPVIAGALNVVLLRRLKDAR